MSARRYALLFAAFLCLAPFAPAGDDKPDKPAADGPPRTDALGDPLPPGVVARLGTERLCHPGAEFLTFAPDNKTLASLDMRRYNLRVWDVRTGKELWRCQGKDVGGPAAFSPDGKQLAVCFGDKTIRVLDAATGRELDKFDTAPDVEQQKSNRLAGLMGQLAFSPDGKRLAAGGEGRSVLLWDLESGKALGEWGDFKRVVSLTYSADGKSLAALSRHDDLRQTLCRWDAATGKELVRQPFPAATRNQLILSHDGDLVAALTDDGKPVSLLDSDTGKELRRCEGETARPVVAFSADGRFLTSNHAGGDIRVWEAATGKVRHQFKAPPSLWRCVALSHDGKLVALNGDSADFAVHIWDAAEGKELHTFPGHRQGLLTVAFSADGKSAYTVSRDAKMSSPVLDWADWSLRQWDPRTGKELRVTEANLKGEVRWAAFSPDGRVLALVMHDGTLRLWDADAGKELCQGKVPTFTQTVISGEPPKTEKFPKAAVSYPAFSADGKTLFAVSGSEVHRWKADTGEELPVIKTPAGDRPDCCFPAPDGRTVLMAAPDRDTTRLTLLNIPTGEVVTPMGGVRESAPACAFSPDGRTLAAADNGGAVILREVAGGRDRGRLTGEAGGRTAGLAFSPDGRLLAVGGKDSVRLIHLASGREVGRVAVRDLVLSLAFSPDGGLLAVGGFSNAALVCDVAAMTRADLPAPAVPTGKELDALWGDLSDADGATAYRAILRLAESPEASVPFLKGRVWAVPKLDAERIPQLIADLDSDDFDAREAASRALARLGTAAKEALTQAREKSASAEVRTRAERLLQMLKKTDGPAPPSPELVTLRALEALENSGTAEARDVLKDLAKGEPDAELTQAAKAALERLEKRPAVPAP